MSDNSLISDWFTYNLNTRTKTYYLGSSGEDCDVTAKLAEQTIKALEILDPIKPSEPLTIILNNQGGEVYPGLAIYDAIRSCESEVVIKVIGSCMSMASIILQAADKREIYKYATMMLHVGTDGIGEDHSENVQRWAKESLRLNTVTDSILMNKIREKHPKFTKKKFEELIRFDTIIDAEQALELGLVDSIIY